MYVYIAFGYNSCSFRCPASGWLTNQGPRFAQPIGKWTENQRMTQPNKISPKDIRYQRCVISIVNEQQEDTLW